MYIQKYLEWKASYAPRASVNYRIWLDRFTEFTGKEVGDLGINDILDFRKWNDKEFDEIAKKFL